MNTVTSAEKKRIEGQMKTALPFINNQVEFEIKMEEGSRGRTNLIFQNSEEKFILPIFYITPSTDDSAWEILTDHIEERNDMDGAFFIQFMNSPYVIQNAKTYVITKQELYGKNVLNEMCRLCSYFNIEPYEMQLFDAKQVKELFEKLTKKDETFEDEKAVDAVETRDAQPIVEPSKSIVKTSVETTEAGTYEDEDTVVKTEERKPAATARTSTVRTSVTPIAEKKESPRTTVQPKKDVTPKPVVTPTNPAGPEDEKLDSDIRALINDCFGLF